MRPLFLLAGLAALPAHADLYRWIDPESGSVKYSSVAPPWYGDEARAARSPAVELVPYQPSGFAPARSSEPEKTAPAAVVDLAVVDLAVVDLEARWRAFLESFATLAASGGLERAGPSLQKQLEGYQELVAELDRLDPGGTKRRRAEEARMLGKLKP